MILLHQSRGMSRIDLSGRCAKSMPTGKIFAVETRHMLCRAGGCQPASAVVQRRRSLEDKAKLVALPKSCDDVLEFFHDGSSALVHQLQCGQVIGLGKLVHVSKLVKPAAVDANNNPCVWQNAIVQLKLLHVSATQVRWTKWWGGRERWMHVVRCDRGQASGAHRHAHVKFDSAQRSYSKRDFAIVVFLPLPGTNPCCGRFLPTCTARNHSHRARAAGQSRGDHHRTSARQSGKPEVRTSHTRLIPG